MKESYLIRIPNPFFKILNKRRCKHEEWDADTQIRTIKCRNCGKEAWIIDYRNLYE